MQSTFNLFGALLDGLVDRVVHIKVGPAFFQGILAVAYTLIPSLGAFALGQGDGVHPLHLSAGFGVCHLLILSAWAVHRTLDRLENSQS